MKALVALTLGEAGRRGAARELKDRYLGTPLSVRLLIVEWRFVERPRVAPRAGVRP